MKLRNALRREDSGYTPLEVLGTLFLIGILVGFLIVRFIGWRDSANDRKAQHTVREAALVSEGIHDQEGFFVESQITADPDLVSVGLAFLGDDAVATGSHKEMVLYLQSDTGNYFGAVWNTGEPLLFCAYGPDAPTLTSAPVGCDFGGGFALAGAGGGGGGTPLPPPAQQDVLDAYDQAAGIYAAFPSLNGDQMYSKFSDAYYYGVWNPMKAQGFKYSWFTYNGVGGTGRNVYVLKHFTSGVGYDPYQIIIDRNQTWYCNDLDGNNNVTYNNAPSLTECSTVDFP